MTESANGKSQGSLPSVGQGLSKLNVDPDKVASFLPDAAAAAAAAAAAGAAKGKVQVGAGAVCRIGQPWEATEVVLHTASFCWVFAHLCHAAASRVAAYCP